MYKCVNIHVYTYVFMHIYMHKYLNFRHVYNGANSECKPNNQSAHKHTHTDTHSHTDKMNF